MKKVKILGYNSENGLENEINEWLSKNSNVKVINISLSSTCNVGLSGYTDYYNYYALIYYVI
jgi:hypothetical protein